jgi:hypothetical protein
MVFTLTCKLCETETCYTTHFCDKCRRIKHLINLYGERVFEVLDKVLVVHKTEQQAREHTEIKGEVTARIGVLKDGATND